jgi:uncharacterized protein (DUF4415 family)
MPPGYTAEELAEQRKRGETRSDWARAAAVTREEIEAQVAVDPDEAGMVVNWDSVPIELPKPDLHMPVDRDVLDYFRGVGKGYQTRTNAVLRVVCRARAAGPTRHLRVCEGIRIEVRRRSLLRVLPVDFQPIDWFRGESRDPSVRRSKLFQQFL